MKHFITVAVASISFFLAAQAQADVCTTPNNLVANCGFETGDLTGWLGAPTNEANNWYGVDNYDAYTGNDGAYLAGFGSNAAHQSNFALIEQTVATVTGRQYVFSYDWAHKTAGDTTASPDNLFLGLINNAAITSSRETNIGNQAFTQFSYTFFAASSSTLLELEAEDANFLFSVDDVSLVAAPEPLTVLLIGPAIAGLFLLRRFRRVPSLV